MKLYEIKSHSNGYDRPFNSAAQNRRNFYCISWTHDIHTLKRLTTVVKNVLSSSNAGCLSSEVTHLVETQASLE